MFRTYELRRFMLFSVSDWNGGMYATVAMAGSRNGAILAGNWASIMKHGREGYVIYCMILYIQVFVEGERNIGGGKEFDGTFGED